MTARTFLRKLAALQEKVTWFKQIDRSFSDTSFSGYLADSKTTLKIAMKIIMCKYPNVKLCYLSGRIYGYTGTGLNPESYIYNTRWSGKTFIDVPVNGHRDLRHSGNKRQVSCVAWSPYFWPYGASSRGDGLKRTVPDDYSSHGVHPSLTGRRKLAQKQLPRQ